jgi:hypothetical protein
MACDEMFTSQTMLLGYDGCSVDVRFASDSAAINNEMLDRSGLQHTVFRKTKLKEL